MQVNASGLFIFFRKITIVHITSFLLVLHTLIERTIAHDIYKCIVSFRSVVVQGLPGVGKTSLLQLLQKRFEKERKVIFFSLKNKQDRDILSIFLDRLKNFEISPSSLFLLLFDDLEYLAENQEIFELLEQLSHISYVATTSRPVLGNAPDTYTLYPFAFQEISHETILKQSFHEYLYFGGMPDVLDTEMEKKETSLQYLEKRWVKMLSGMCEITPMSMKSILILLLRWLGKPLDIGMAALSLDMSRGEFESMLYFLEATGIIFLVHKYEGSPEDQVKLYFVDTGVLRMFAHPDEGAIFENAVFLQLRQYGHVEYAIGVEGKEIDFILDKKIAYEVKTKLRCEEYNEYKSLAKKMGFEVFRMIVKESQIEREGVISAEFL